MGSGGGQDPTLVHRALQSISRRTPSDLAAILLQEVVVQQASSSSRADKKKGIDTLAFIFASELGRAQTRYLDVDQSNNSVASSDNGENDASSKLASNLRAIFSILIKLSSRADSGLLRQILTSAGSSSQSPEENSNKDAFVQIIARLACAARWLILCGSAAAKGSDGIRKEGQWSVKAIRKVIEMLLDEHTCSALLQLPRTSSSSGIAKFRLLSAVLLVLPTCFLKQAKHKAQLQELARQLSQSYAGEDLQDAASGSAIPSESSRIDCLDAAALLFARLPVLQEKLAEINETSAPARRMLDDLRKQPTAVGRLFAETSSSLFNDLRAARRMNVSKKGTSSRVTEGMLEQIHAILPHYTKSTLQRELHHAQYAGKSVEEIVQMLLDHGLTSRDASSALQGSALQPTQRANIFDDASLISATRLDKGKGKGKARQEEDLEGLSGDLKRLIIARSNAPRSDDEDEEEDPMNPFAGLDGVMRGAEEADEEEEGEEEPTGIWRRQRLSNLTGPRANARDWRQKLEDWEESESSASEGESGGGAGGAPGTAKGGSTNNPSALSGAEAERAAERILIRFYADFGEKVFEKTPESRKGRERKQLKDALSQVEVQGKAAWDDHMIESWGTLFARNVSSIAAVRCSVWQLLICMTSRSLGRTSCSLHRATFSIQAATQTSCSSSR